jgi:hypothetical protein
LKAARLCSADVRTEFGADVVGYVAHDEWEMALVLLQELGDVQPCPPAFWTLLADVARLLWLESDVVWYEWRRSEASAGAFLAELSLHDGGRATAIPPGRLLRPMWDIGLPTGEFAIAGLWVEGRVALEPGRCARVRLVPLTPEYWGHLVPGDVVTMHETRVAAGSARIVQVVPPVPMAS